jgi:hypothetical protein
MLEVAHVRCSVGRDEELNSIDQEHFVLLEVT